MEIKYLLVREPFGEILEKTLSSYFSGRYGQAFNFLWLNPGYPRISTQGQQVWLCNPRIDAIYLPGRELKTLAPAKAIFRHTPIWWKRLFQRAYVDLVTHPTFSRWFSYPAMVVFPPVPRAEKYLLMGGRNRLRLLDTEAGRITTILKSGFDKIYMEREIEVRRHENSSCIQPLLASAPDSSWYEESLVPGVGLNRLSSLTNRRLIEGKLADWLLTWYQPTISWVSPINYGLRLAQQIDHLSEHISFLDNKDRDELTHHVALLVGRVKKLSVAGSNNLPLAFTHGDLQAGNVLADSDNFWLVDWENASQRQLAYDFLVYALNSRFPFGLSHRIKVLLSAKQSADCGQWIWHLPWLADATIDQLMMILIVFLLEEILFYLEENGSPYLRTISDSWVQFNTEVPSLLKMLKALH